MHLRSAKEDKHQHRRAGGTLEPPGFGSVAVFIHEIEKINFGWRNTARGGVPICLVRTFWGGAFISRGRNFPAWLSDEDGAVELVSEACSEAAWTSASHHPTHACQLCAHYHDGCSCRAVSCPPGTRDLQVVLYLTPVSIFHWKCSPCRAVGNLRLAMSAERKQSNEQSVCVSGYRKCSCTVSISSFLVRRNLFRGPAGDAQ